MDKQSLMQQVLGEQWQQLAPALRAHYQYSSNVDVGALDIEYPGLMQFYLNILRFFGALLNRRGHAIPATVGKHMQGHVQYWNRTLCLPDGKTIVFNSQWVYAGNNELIEYVNPVLGLRMAVHVENGQLYYTGRHIVLRLGKLLVPIPESLVLGHTTIVEIAKDPEHFTMDFRLQHPLFGQLYRYAGKFRTVLQDLTPSGS